MCPKRQRPYLKLLYCAAFFLVGFANGPAPAINITLDYSYDTSNFFGAGNPQGAAAGNQARASLEAAASFFSTILDDTFSAITVPVPYYSSVPGSTGVVTWSWQESFTHPTTGAGVQVSNATIPADQYVIFAGARAMGGNTAGRGGPGGYGWQNQISGTNSFTNNDINQINAITSSFSDAVVERGEPSGFARWGGAISFDTSSRTWHYNHTTSPSGNVTDFYSVAIHELAHALGFGERDSSPTNVTAWENLVSGSSFYGSNSTTAYGGPVPLHTTDPDPAQNLSHWASDTGSVAYGTSTAQETAMDPSITGGTRKRFTELDAAAMKDIGWTVVPLPGVNGDYNNNGIVDAADYTIWRKRLNQSITIPNDATPGYVSGADYTVWRRNFGETPGGGAGGGLLATTPEPASAALAMVCCAALYCTRRKRRG